MPVPNSDFTQFKEIVGPEFSQSAKDIAHQGGPLSAIPSIGAIAFDYLVIVAIILVDRRLNSWPFYFLTIFIIAGRQHGLMILVHEAVHGLLSPNRKFNQFLAEFFCALPLGIFFSGYKANHLAHHKYLNTEADPDWARKSKAQWKFPTSVLGLLKFLIIQVTVVFPRDRAKRIWNMLFIVKHTATYRILLYSFYIGAFALLTVLDGFQFFLLYWLTPLWVALPIIFLVRSIAEHFGLKYESVLSSSRDVKSHFLNLIFIPHQSGYHLTHHIFPTVPWYRLKKTATYLTENSLYNEKAQVVDGYFFGKKTLLQEVLEKPRK